MIPAFPYMAMTITGILHIIFGVVIFINAMVGFSMKVEIQPYEWRHFSMYENDYLTQVVHVYLGVVTGASLWIIMVGILGILTGVKSMEHKKTYSLKIAYMVTAILSATIFSLVGISLSAVVNQNLFNIGIVGSLCSFADFVLAIVSSSICCCCSSTNVTNVVVVQSSDAEHFPPPYPASGQGYPPSGQGYPLSGQGYPPSGQAYPISQVPEEGFTNPGYQPNGPAVTYTVKQDMP